MTHFAELKHSHAMNLGAVNNGSVRTSRITSRQSVGVVRLRLALSDASMAGIVGMQGRVATEGDAR